MKHYHYTLRMAFSMAALMVSVTRPSYAEVTLDWATVGNPGNAAEAS